MVGRVDPLQISFEKLAETHMESIYKFQNQEEDLVNFLCEDALENQKRAFQ